MDTFSDAAAAPVPEASSATATLERGLQVLRAFRAERKPLTNAELMRRTGLPRSSVSRLTCTLVNLGYLRRLSGGQGLVLAAGGLGIGYAYESANPVTQRVHPLMQSLADRLNVSVALAVPNRLDMLYVACRASMQIATLRLDVGSLLPMGTTATGRAWLWALPQQEQQDYLHAIEDAAGREAPGLMRSIRQAFDELDEYGVCTLVSVHAYGIALPLRVGSEDTLMALNCGAAGVDLDPAALRTRAAPGLKHLAQDIQALLRDVNAKP